MATWKLVGDPISYTGGADPSADVDGGWKFTLRHEDGRETAVNIESARGAGALTRGAARDAVAMHLDDETPPSRIVMGTDGGFYPSS